MPSFVLVPYPVVLHEQSTDLRVVNAASSQGSHNGVYFCPEAWYLQRFFHSPDVQAIQRLHDGSMSGSAKQPNESSIPTRFAVAC